MPVRSSGCPRWSKSSRFNWPRKSKLLATSSMTIPVQCPGLMPSCSEMPSLGLVSSRNCSKSCLGGAFVACFFALSVLLQPLQPGTPVQASTTNSSLNAAPRRSNRGRSALRRVVRPTFRKPAPPYRQRDDGPCTLSLDARGAEESKTKVCLPPRDHFCSPGVYA